MMETILTTEDVILHVVALYQLSLVKQSMLYQSANLSVQMDTYLNQKKNVMISEMDVIVLVRVLIQVMLAQIQEEQQPVHPSVGMES